MSPRRRKAEDVDVFAALVRVMQRCGPAELTLREIAAEAGVTAGALVQRFGSKRAMLLAHARYAAGTGDIGVTAPHRYRRRRRASGGYERFGAGALNRDHTWRVLPGVGDLSRRLCRGLVARKSGGHASTLSGAKEEPREAQMKLTPCVISAADHAGWAHLVCVAAPGNVPTVVERRRVTTIDKGLPTMPYHHESLGMPVNEANALIARVQRSVA